MSEKQGTIVQVMGPVVDVAFDGGALPELKEALEVELDGRREVMEVAQHVGGSVKGFVSLMNEKARELGMEHSSFANPNGLDDEQHYSTARDMAKLARAALENETLMRIASTRSVTIGGRTMTNHNKLLH